MTIEIINPEPDPEAKKEVVCLNCGARLSYVPADVIRRKDAYCFIPCPKCASNVTVKCH